MADKRPRLFTIAQAAAALGVHQNTLRNWADKGRVPVLRLPSGHRRFTEAQVAKMRQDMGLGELETALAS
jgi:excisionase family DNA binding protein